MVEHFRPRGNDGKLISTQLVPGSDAVLVAGVIQILHIPKKRSALDQL